MKKVCIVALAFSVACMASAGTLTVEFGSAMEVEFDGEVQKFAKGATFVPVAIPCLYRMRPVLAEGERTFAIEGSETIRKNAGDSEDKCWRFPQGSSLAQPTTNGAHPARRQKAMPEQ